MFGVDSSFNGDCSAVGLLTRGLIDRTAYYEHSLTLALAPFGEASSYYYDLASADTGRAEREPDRC